jgi:predicted nucleic acid-binding protein
MKVVVNATPLIALAILQRLELLPQLFEEVFVPPIVFQEVAVRGANRPGRANIVSQTRMIVRAPEANATIEPLLMGLDAGEFQVILLGRELQADWVLIDERLGRRVALSLGLPVKGTLGILLVAVRAGLISKVEAKESAQELLENGLRLSSQLIEMFESELDRF